MLNRFNNKSSSGLLEFLSLRAGQAGSQPARDSLLLLVKKKSQPLSKDECAELLCVCTLKRLKAFKTENREFSADFGIYVSNPWTT